EIRNSPSRKDGISEVLEKEYRRKTCFFIKAAGKSLDLPMEAIATAHVFFHRFFILQSFHQHDRFVVASACVFLASKVEESPRKVEHIVIQCHAIWTRAKKPLESKDKCFRRLREKVLIAERCLLNTLSFQLSVQHPYTEATSHLRNLKQLGEVGNVGSGDISHGGWGDTGPGRERSRNRQLLQATISMVNDSLLTTLCLQYTPREVAAGVVYLTHLFMDMPRGDISLLGVEEVVVSDICDQILALYDKRGACHDTLVVTGLRDLLKSRLDSVPPASIQDIPRISPTDPASPATPQRRLGSPRPATKPGAGADSNGGGEGANGV
ncbi:unnamed protein product, partial [Discosporangium mesarthrocarpum]